MAKSYPITVRLTEEQKNFIEEKIAHIKNKVDLDVEIPIGLVIRKIIDRAMAHHEARKMGNEAHGMHRLKEYLYRSHGRGYEQREGRFEDFLKIIEEYNSEEEAEKNEK